MKQIKTIAAALAVCGAAGAAMAFLYGDTPDARHAWAVHDRNRPNPVKISAEPGVPPSDAIILFDGSQESFEKNWCNDKGGPTKWKFVNGTLESVARAGNICSRRHFGDVQLHVEWQPPEKVSGVGQGRGNSGVFLLGGAYEVQVLDSWETDPSNMKNPNYADGQAGAVYGQNPPLVNPTRKPGDWQVYDIVFHQPIFDGNTLVHPGSLTVFLNGVLVQDHWELEGPTYHVKRTSQQKPPASGKGSIQFQDHGNPVHFRNIWVREIPSRYANTTHGTFLANEKDVTAFRQKTAAELFAKVDFNNRINAIRGILEVASYDMNPKYQQKLPELQNAFLADFNKLTKEQADKRKWEVFTLRGDLDVLIRNGVFPRDNAFRAELDKIIAKYQLKK